MNSVRLNASTGTLTIACLRNVEDYIPCEFFKLNIGVPDIIHMNSSERLFTIPMAKKKEKYH